MGNELSGRNRLILILGLDDHFRRIELLRCPVSVNHPKYSSKLKNMNPLYCMIQSRVLVQQRGEIMKEMSFS